MFPCSSTQNGDGAVDADAVRRAVCSGYMCPATMGALCWQATGANRVKGEFQSSFLNENRLRWSFDFCMCQCFVCPQSKLACQNLILSSSQFLSDASDPFLRPQTSDHSGT